MDGHSLNNMVFLMEAIAKTNKDFGDAKLSKDLGEVFAKSIRLSQKIETLSTRLEAIRICQEGRSSL